MRPVQAPRVISSRSKLPIFMYFLVVGSALFASLFVVEAHFPAAPMQARKEVDKSIIRIHAPPRQSLPAVSIVLD